MTALAVLSIASEIYPLVKTGGLADVAGALPAALAREDVAIRTLAPGYPAVVAKLESAEPARVYASLFGGPARVLANDQAWPVSAPAVQGPSWRSTAAVGPALHLPAPSRGSVALGRIKPGPAPQYQPCIGWSGER